jgi:hypothetical protein
MSEKDIEVGQGKRKEKINWWTLDPMAEFKSKLESLVNKTCNSFDPRQIEYILVVYGGDHGKSKFRFVSKLIVKMKDKEPHNVIYPLADVECKKDTGKVLKNTVIPNLKLGVDGVEGGSIHFQYDEASKMWKCLVLKDDEIPQNTKTIKPMALHAGDIAYLCTILGKENFDGVWCYICQLYKTEWQNANHIQGDKWTIERLKAQAQTNRIQDLKGTDRRGVREDPYFNIPVENVVWPLLHALIGIGNNLLTSLLDFGENEIQCVTRREIDLRTEYLKMLQLEEETKAKKGEWDKESKGRLKRMTRNLEVLEHWFDENINEHAEYEQKELELIATKFEVDYLKSQIDEYTEILAKTTPKIKKLKDQLDAYKKKRKTDVNSVYTGIDEILQKYGIRRGAYHGGDLQGNDVMKLMEQAKDISADIADLMIRSKHATRCKFNNDQISEICGQYETALILWDAVFAKCQIVSPTESDLVETEVYLQYAMRKTRELGLSITPKLHGMEDHVIQQMRTYPGGIAMLIESWVEQYHQTGYGLDVKHKNQKSTLETAKVRIRKETTRLLPEVQQEIEKNKEKHQRGKRKSTVEKEESMKKAKEERRKLALNED